MAGEPVFGLNLPRLEGKGQLRDGVGRVRTWGRQGRRLGGPCRWAPALPARTMAAFAGARQGEQKGAAPAQGAELAPGLAASTVLRRWAVSARCSLPQQAPSLLADIKPLSVFAGAAGLSLGTKIGLSAILVPAGAAIGKMTGKE